jgi:hypothetical protein
MQGASYSSDKKRKAVEDSSPVASTSAGKKIRSGKSPNEARETLNDEPQWPDYFKEVSVREAV